MEDYKLRDLRASHTLGFFVFCFFFVELPRSLFVLFWCVWDKLADDETSTRVSVRASSPLCPFASLCPSYISLHPVPSSSACLVEAGGGVVEAVHVRSTPHNTAVAVEVGAAVAVVVAVCLVVSLFFHALNAFSLWLYSQLWKFQHSESLCWIGCRTPTKRTVQSSRHEGKLPRTGYFVDWLRKHQQTRSLRSKCLSIPF